MKKRKDREGWLVKGNPTKGNNHWTKKQLKGKVATLVKKQLKKQKPDADAGAAELDKLLAVLASSVAPLAPHGTVVM